MKGYLAEWQKRLRRKYSTVQMSTINAQMAPRLSDHLRRMIKQLLLDSTLNDKDIAELGRCLASVFSPRTRGGGPKSLEPHMPGALKEELYKRCIMYQDERVEFIGKKFDVWISKQTISRALNGLEV